jgi:hypothetical protein
MSEASEKPLKADAQGIDHLKVLECYTTRSGPRLAALFDQLYSPDTTFADPFVIATPRYEARLQFLSLQHFFDSITATVADSTTSAGNETRMNVHFEYFWARNSWFSRMIFPEVTPLDAVVILKQDPATGKIISHVDEWRSPAVGALPTLLRQANVKSLNAVFRLLGWESELKEQNSYGSGFTAAAATKEE